MKNYLSLTLSAVLTLSPILMFTAQAESVDSLSLETNQQATRTPLAQDRMTLSVRSSTYAVTNEQDFLTAAYDSLAKYDDQFTISYTGPLTAKNLGDQFTALWKNMFNVDDYLAGQIKTFRWDWAFSGNTKTATITIEYWSNFEQQQYITKKVNEVIPQIIHPGMSDFEKVKAINDYIVLNYSYSKLTINPRHSLYTFVTEGQAVCMAYALLAQRLFTEAGIPSHYVIGDVPAGLHAWNLVQVDGDWYHIDVTWNDPYQAEVNERNRLDLRYNYFLMSDQQIAKDHKIAAKETLLPKATNNRFTAFHSIQNPVQLGDTLYFPNKNDNLKLYGLDLNAHTPRALKVSDTRYQHVFYANEAIYFSNYSQGGYLYKLDLNTMQEELVVREKITHILKQGEELIAYNDKNIVYREYIQSYGNGGDDIYAEIIEPDFNETRPIDTPSTATVYDKIAELDETEEAFFQQIVEIIYMLDELGDSFYEEIEQLDEEDALEVMETLDRYLDIATDYADQMDIIYEAISKIDEDTDLATLAEQVQTIRAMIEEAPAAIIANVDNLNLLETYERIILDLEHGIQNLDYEDIDDLVEQAVSVMEEIELLHPDFEEQAKKLLAILHILGDQADEFFDDELIEQINYVIEKYGQLIALSFDDGIEMTSLPKTRNVNKVWNIQLSSNVVNTAQNLEKVYVLDMFGDFVDADVSVHKNRIFITPVESYEKGVRYTIVLEEGLKSARGKQLQTTNYLHFTIH